ncbi:MAG: sensor histidine kinase [Saprospiraceae bacterium]
MKTQRLQLSAYWWCQLLGWGVVAPFWLYYELNNQPLGEALVVVLIQVALQILMTDAYRRVVHRKGWLALPLAKQLPIIFTAWLLLIAQYLLMVFLLFTLRYDYSFLDNSTLLGALAGGTRYHAIWLLGFHLYHFARQSADQAAAAARNSQLATEAQLAKLSNELNPHFFFNALNGIKALTREDPARARLAIDRLAELLRYSLRQSAHSLVLLSEEIHIIKEYVALEQMRLEERLQVKWDIGIDTSDCELPPLSLHTLVENAIKHGINSLPEGGSVIIRLDETKSHWQFSVTNDGTFVSAAPTGSGLANLRRRLELQYPGTAAFNISAQSVGSIPQVIAILKIPKQ